MNAEGKYWVPGNSFSLLLQYLKIPERLLCFFPWKLWWGYYCVLILLFFLKPSILGHKTIFFKPILKGNAREYSVSIICLMPGIEWSVWGNFPIGQNGDSITLFFIIPYKPRSIGRRALKLSPTLLWSSKRTLKNISLSGIDAIISNTLWITVSREEWVMSLKSMRIPYQGE